VFSRTGNKRLSKLETGFEYRKIKGPSGKGRESIFVPVINVLDEMSKVVQGEEYQVLLTTGRQGAF